MLVHRPAVSISKNFVTDQTLTNVFVALAGTGNWDVTEGWGSTGADSKIIGGFCGGFNDQKVTAICKYPSGSDNFGPVVRAQQLVTNTERDYYQARVQGGNARITKVLNDTHTNIAGPTAFALAAGTLVTITLEIRGNALKASFVADGGSPASVLNMTATDSDIPAGGIMGWRTLTTPGWIRQITMEAV